VKTFSVQSGSNGNCIYVEADDVRLLFDAGVSGRCAEGRMATHHRRIRECDALIVSHDHWDHASGAGVFHRKFRLPVFMTRGAYEAVRFRVGAMSDVRWFKPGERLRFGPLTVTTIPTPHDGIDTVCFLIEHEGRRLGIFTDLGHPFAALGEALSRVHAAYIESNYDVEMLMTGEYPESLKQRISGKHGHLSNDEAAATAARHVNGGLEWLAVAHLSAHNNRPYLAVRAMVEAVGRQLPVYVASRYEASDVREV
jgi:phosphoribosyl 1,2-cyclic phosphodiesterase